MDAKDFDGKIKDSQKGSYANCGENSWENSNTNEVAEGLIMNNKASI